MRRLLAAVAILLLRTPSAALAETDSLAVARLAALGRVWGAAKFFHPALAYRDVAWDAALIETIPLVDAARSEGDLAAAFDHLLSFLDDPHSRTWTLEDAGADAAPPVVPPEPPAVVPLGDGLVRVVATDWQALLGADAASLEGLLTGCRDARGIVLDLRNRSGSSFSSFGARLQDALPVLLDVDLSLPAVRTRMHCGYPPQSGSSSGGYETGVFRREHSLLFGKADRPPAPIVALVSGHSRDVVGPVSALQCAGLATVIQEGDEEPWSSDPYHWISVSDSVGVILCTRERVNPDGTIGFHPDLVVEEASPERDPSLERAVAILRGEEKPAVARLPAPPVRRFTEEAYADLDPVPREYRLLGLFRMWHIIRLFYPYHELLDRPWEDTLVEFLPQFESAQSRLEYLLTARRLAARMQDSHANVWMTGFSPFGRAAPPITTRRIEGRWIVHAVADSSLEDRVSAGDVLLAVDGEPSEERAQRLARFLPASTPQALDWQIAKALLRGDEGSEALLELERENGRRVTVASLRAEGRHTARGMTKAERGRPVFGVLPEGFGYVDLERLELSEVSAALQAVEGTPGLIFDLRGYPKGVAWLIGPRLARKVVTAARFRRPVHLGPEEADGFFHEFEQKIEPRDHWNYERPIVVLIDEDAISQAEHTCLHLEAALEGNVTFIGTPTNGANGDVTNFPIPGGLTVGFTGHDVRHGDGRQLQRVGIQPDVLVAPTIAGIRRGEDEVLAAAVRFLREAE
jgi:C-terminal processing protease CtpA/Prc